MTERKFIPSFRRNHSSIAKRSVKRERGVKKKLPFPKTNFLFKRNINTRSAVDLFCMAFGKVHSVKNSSIRNGNIPMEYHEGMRNFTVYYGG